MSKAKCFFWDFFTPKNYTDFLMRCYAVMVITKQTSSFGTDNARYAIIAHAPAHFLPPLAAPTSRGKDGPKRSRANSELCAVHDFFAKRTN